MTWGGGGRIGLAAARLRRAPSRGLRHMRGLSGVVGSTGVGGGGALDGLAAERLRRAPSRGVSASGGISGIVGSTRRVDMAR